MKPNCAKPYPRKRLYFLLTIPMVFLYLAIAWLLFTYHWAYMLTYLAMFIMVALSMSFACHHWQCPYVGKFAPCVGGFCLPSSRIAVLWKEKNRNETRYKAMLNLAYFCFFGIILFPLPFLFLYSWMTMLLYILVILVYAILFSLYICPVCETRFVCPGGQSAVKLQQWIKTKKK